MQGTLSKLKHKALNFSSIYLPNSISCQIGKFLQAFAFIFEIYRLVWKILFNLYSYFLWGLNHQPIACMTCALPIELFGYMYFDVLYSMHYFKIKTLSLRFLPQSIYQTQSLAMLERFYQAIAFLFEIYLLFRKIIFNLYS